MKKRIIDITSGKGVRHELIYISRTHFLVGAIVIINSAIAASIYQYHNNELFQLAKARNTAITTMTRAERDVKNEIRELEGARLWKDTAYATARPWTSGE